MLDFVYGDPIRFLPCMHIYHMDCIDDWLMRSFTCPSCMEPVDAALLSTYETNWSVTPRPPSLGQTRPFQPQHSHKPNNCPLIEWEELKKHVFSVFLHFEKKILIYSPNVGLPCPFWSKKEAGLKHQLYSSVRNCFQMTLRDCVCVCLSCWWWALGMCVFGLFDAFPLEPASVVFLPSSPSLPLCH